MTSSATPETDSFTRATRWAGDLDHPFYNDERNRWVWYEASAIGFQIALMASFFAAGIAVLAQGVTVGWALFLMMPVTVASLVATGHVSRHSADYAPTLFDLRRSRGIIAMSGPVFFAIAAIVDGLRSESSTGDATLSGIGIAIAVLFGVGASVWAQRLQKKQTARHLAELDDLD